MLTGGEWLVIGSGGALLLCMLVFGLLGRLSAEHWYHRTTATIDSLLSRFLGWCKQLRYRLGFTTARLTIHYLLHKFLQWLRTFLTKAAKYVRGLERSNREKAKSVKKDKANHSHLDKIAKHKRDYSLTEEQKVELKRSSLEVG